MRIPRIYHPTPLRVGEKATLSAEATQHVKHVLRLKIGHMLTIFSGDGSESVVKIVEIQKTVIVEVQSHDYHCIESPQIIYLWQGICRGERMDWIIQKATELGIHTIIPVLTERSIVRLDVTRTKKRQDHWERVVISACEQCGRNRLPTLLTPMMLSEMLTLDTPGLMMDPTATCTLRNFNLSVENKTIHLFVGPEGGISSEEKNWLQTKNFQPIQMGPRILRTETAALTAIALIQSRWGDL